MSKEILTQLSQKIETSRVYETMSPTPLQKMITFSSRVQDDVYLKREDLTPIHSFKIRGAYNKLSQLSPSIKKQGIIASSAGNHAQGVAQSALKLDIEATIVMPKTTPQIKVDAVRRFNATVILHGDIYDEAYNHALNLSQKQGLTFIHPYDDFDVMAGQGTIGMELLKDMRAPIDAIFVPVGGGGLAAGVVAYIKTHSPKTKVFGVEPEDSACLNLALKKQYRATLKRVGIFADGVAVRQIGKEPFSVLKDHIDGVILVSIDEICAAIKDIFNDTRSIAEPAGALALAGLKKQCLNTPTPKPRRLVAIHSGSNMNFDRLRHVSERADVGEQKEALFSVIIPEQRGSFKTFCSLLNNRSVTEFNYRYADPKNARIFVGIETENGKDDRRRYCSLFREQGYDVLDLTDNELAKLHLRHMGDGKSERIANERLFRFQFPERPGALLEFLSKVGRKWNISLFHYRNHGAAYGRILIGMQVPNTDKPLFKAFMASLPFTYFEETNNPAASHIL